MKWLLIILLLFIVGCTAVFVSRSRAVDVQIDDDMKVMPRADIKLDSSLNIQITDTLYKN